MGGRAERVERVARACLGASASGAYEIKHRAVVERYRDTQYGMQHVGRCKNAGVRESASNTYSGVSVMRSRAKTSMMSCSFRRAL